jgi:hypothetical protein
MARSFNGSSDVIQTSAISFTDANLTASAWVKVSAFPAAYSLVISGFNSGATGAVFAIYVKSSGKLAMYYNNSSSSYDGTGTNTLSLNTWYHLLFLGTSSTFISGYVNGSFDANGNTNYPSINCGSILAGASGSAGQYLNGSIADFAVWKTVLSTSEILALANGARPGSIRSGLLELWWPFDGIQSPEPDFSGLARNGTLTGTTLAFGPPVMMFTPRWPQFTEIATAPTFSPAWARNRNTVIEGVAT